MKTQPIKRSDELKTLSREHHLGLLFTWKIKEGIKLNVETPRLRAYMNYFWEGHLKNHFLNEDVLLFDRIDQPVCRQAKEDHQAIIAMIDQINSSQISEHNTYLKLVEKIVEHIRFEERIAFPYLEKHLAPSTLYGVSHFLDKESPDDFKDSYSDEFWIKLKDNGRGSA